MAFKANIVTYKQPSTTPPINPRVGDIWWQTDGGKYCKYVNNRWVCTDNLKGGDTGYVFGGYNSSGKLSYIQKIIFPFDSGICNSILPDSYYYPSSVNSSQYAYSLGGYNVSTTISRIIRINFDLQQTAISVGSLSVSKYGSFGYNSSICGYSAGGVISSIISSIEKILFSSDSGTTSIVTNLSTVMNSGASCNSSQYGFCMNTAISSSTNSSVINRHTFSIDSTTAALVGNTTISKQTCFGFNSSLHGFSCGGTYDNGSTATSIIDAILFPFSSGTSTNVGNLASTKRGAGGLNSKYVGVVVGGYEGSTATIVDTIQLINFPFSGAAQIVSNSPIASAFSAATDNTDFVSMFV